jgi:hypothetical protein
MKVLEIYSKGTYLIAKLVNTIDTIDPVRAVHMNENFIVGGVGSNIKLWDVDSYHNSHVFVTGIDGRVNCLDLKKNLVAAGVGNIALLTNIDPSSSEWFGERNELNGHVRV